MTYIYVLAAVAAIGIFRATARRLARYSLFVLPVLMAACQGAEEPSCADAGDGGGGHVTQPHPCAVVSDCEAYLAPGPCGAVACDAFGLVGEPEIPGIPKGCYVRIALECQGAGDAGESCSENTDCPPLRCYRSACAEGACSFMPEPAGTSCDANSFCDGDGVCAVTT